MINSLRIKNFGIIQDLQVDFSDGFNVLTGETGAGKSILIKALSALLGGKAGTELIRFGAERAEISAVFTVNSKHPVLKFLEELGILYEATAAPQILFRRVISTKGKAGTWVNDVHIAQNSAKELGQKLMDIFGQNDSFRMTSSHRHAELLDRFLPEKVLASFQSSTQQVLTAAASLKKVYAALVKMSSQMDYLKFRAQELGEFKLDSTEYEDLKDRSVKIREAIQVSETLSSISQYFYGSEDTIGINQSIREVQRRIEKINHQDWVQGILGKVGELSVLADDLSYAIESVISKSSDQESQVELIESRLHGYQDLMRKLSCSSIEELISSWEDIQTKLFSYQSNESELGANLVGLIKLLDIWIMDAQSLSLERESASKELSELIEKEFRDLSMKDARLKVRLDKKQNSYEPSLIQDLEKFISDTDLISKVREKLNRFHPQGFESVDFWLTANKGEALQPLERVASGGEISRIMLALKKVLSDGADACVLVFDEIDSGISGRVANMVGAKLKEMSASFQILCISHLPQVAAYADRHFKVEKLVNQERTTSSIVVLSQEDSVSEIASMISGEKLNDASIAHAQELKKAARQNNLIKI